MDIHRSTGIPPRQSHARSWGRVLLPGTVIVAVLFAAALLMPGRSLAATSAAPRAVASHGTAGTAGRAAVRVTPDAPQQTPIACVYTASKPVHQRNTGKNRRKYPYEIVAKGALVRCVPRDPAVCRTEEQLLMGVPLPDGSIDWNVIARGAIDYRCPGKGAQSVTATLLCRDTHGTPYYWKSRTLLTIEDEGRIATGHVDGNRIFSRC